MHKGNMNVYKRSMILFGFILVNILSLHIYAASGGVNSSQSEINKGIIWKGESVDYTFSLTDYAELNDGINAVKGTLVYDAGVFGSISADDFRMQNGWESFFYNPETKEFVAIKKVGSKEPEAVFTLSLTTQKDVAATSTYIGVTDVSTSQGEKDIFPKASGTTIDVVSDAQGSINTNNNQTLTNQQGLYTGDKSLTNLYMLAILVSVLLLVVVVAKLRLDKYGYVFANDGKVKKNYRFICKYIRKNKVVLIFGLIILCSLVAVNQIYAYTKKGELNQDGVIDHADIVLLEKHLISLTTLTDAQQKVADMNSDGELTVTDLSILLKRVEKTIKYDVTLESMMDTYHFSKNENIILKFRANISNGGKIESVVIDGKVYKVSEKEANEYHVTLSKESEAGIKEYKITEIILTTGRKISVDYAERIDVLKEDIRIENYEVEEDVKKAQMKVSFDVVDKDNAMTEGCLHIINEENGEEIVSETVKAGKNSFSFNLKEDEKYIFHLEVMYQTDHKELEVENKEYTKTIKLDKELIFNIDYQFQFEDMKLYSISMKEIQELSKNESYRIGFKTSNVTEYAYDRAIVNGEAYPIKEEGGIFFVEMPAYHKSGKETVKIEALVLENGKKFILSENNTVSVNIVKEKAKVKEAKVKETDDSIDVNLDIYDPDQALTNKKIVLKDASGKLLFKKAFKDNTIKEVFKLGNTLTTSYTMEVIADSSLGGNNETEIGKVIYKQEIKAKTRVIIESVNLNKTYLEKGEEVELTYILKKNITDEITKLVVNNQVLDVKTSGNTYTVNYKAQTTSGQHNLVLSQVVLGKEKVNVENTQNIEVLKSIPTATDYSVTDNFDKNTATLNFIVNDEDVAFVSGKVQLIDSKNQIVEKTINKVGQQNITFNVTEKEAYTAKVYITYDKSSDGKNRMTDVLVLEKPVQLIKDYEIKLSSIKTYSDKQETIHFEKNSKVSIRFTGTTASIYKYAKVVLDGKAYALTSDVDNQYTFTIDGLKESGVKNFIISKVILENGKEIEVTENNKFEIEVLKDIPTVENFTGGKNINNKIEATFTLKDEDVAIKSATSVLKDNLSELVKSTTTSGEIKLVSDLKETDVYQVIITINYQRDTKGNVTDTLTFEKEVKASKDAIELKNVSNITLYKTDGTKSTKVDMLDITNGVPTNTEDYYAVVASDFLPKLYSGVKEFRYVSADKKLKVVLSQEDLIQPTSDGGRVTEYSFDMPYKNKSGEHYLITKADAFFKQIANDLNGTHNLTEDLDASNISSETTAILGSFKGTLNGNGHKILNLKTAMFETIDGGNINNLIIENANVTTNAKGILANTIKGTSTIQKVYIMDAILTNNQSQVGGMTGLLDGSATIKESAIVNLNLKANNTIGGIAGQSNSNTKIENSYVTGKLSASQYGNNLGARVGGLSGWHSGTIEACFVKIDINSQERKGNGGFIGGPDNGTPIIKKSLAITTGNAYRVSGFDVASKFENVYEYSKTSATTNIKDTNSNIKEVVDLTKDFYKNTLGFNESIWYLDLIDNGKLPSLKEDPVAKDIKDYDIQDNVNNIANYQGVRNHKEYKAERETAYYNISRLMPYADTEVWVEKGNKVNENSNFYKKRIQYILSIDGNNQLIVGITRDNADSIRKVRIIYTDDSQEEKTISFKNTLGNIVANYEMNDSVVGYQFPKYISNIDKDWLQTVVTKATGYNYDTISAITSENESRLYADYYNESVKSRIQNMLINVLTSQADYPTYFNNSVVQKEWRNTFISDDNLKQLLYAYNYYDKWYHFTFNGIKLSDLLFFNGQMFSDKMTVKQLITDLLNTSANNRAVNYSNGFYDNVLKKYTSKDMMSFIGKLGVVIGKYNTANDWFATEFKGLLLEQNITSDKYKVKYRVWDIMSGVSKKNLLLPILSAPQEDMFIITTPSQIMLGSLNAYGDYHKENGRQKMYENMQFMGELIGKMYATSANWVPNAEKILNSYVDIQFDTLINFPAYNEIEGGTQVYGKTNDPVIKWVYEPCAKYHDYSGSGALAYGNEVYWTGSKMLNISTYTFYLYSHETAHNQDGKYYYNGYGRRDYSGAETHADGNLSQQVIDGVMTFNMVYEHSPTSDLVSNFSYKSIDTPDKLYKFYNGMFETGYVLDYLAAQAFLKLTPEQQAKVVLQAREEGTTSFTTYYDKLDAGKIKAMNLKDMSSLWDNKIVWKEKITKAGPSTGGEYNNDSFYDFMWYQPHNDNGTPDNLSFKRLGQEMLGLKGYIDGYLKYVSNYLKVIKPELGTLTDLNVLQEITGQANITWKDYKLGRYKEVESKLNQITYFDTNEVIEQFKQAFIEDGNTGKKTNVTQVKRLWYGIVKRATNEFSNGGVYDENAAVTITSAKDFVDKISQNPMGHYKLGADIDFNDITGQNGNYIPTTFLGVLDGAGHKLNNVHYTLFKDMQYGIVKNLTIENPNYRGESEAYISKTGRNITIRNVKVNNSNINFQLVKTKTGSYIDKDNSMTSSAVEIGSTEQFLSELNSDVGLFKKIKLTQDLDFTNIKGDGLNLIAGTFNGELDGQNHTIKGLTSVLFESMLNAKIMNLQIENSNISDDSQHGILANTATNSSISNVKIKDATLTGIKVTGQIKGGLVGTIDNGTIDKITIENINIDASHNLGGLAGFLNNSHVKDIVVTGVINGKYWHTGTGNVVGGIAGKVTNSTIENAFTKVTLKAEWDWYLKSIGTGGILGAAEGTSVIIKNSVSASDVNNKNNPAGYRIAGFDVLGNSSNVYELSSSNALTNITEKNKEQIKSVEEATLKNLDFYKNTLQWSDTVWDFTDISNTGIPKLK